VTMLCSKIDFGTRSEEKIERNQNNGHVEQKIAKKKKNSCSVKCPC